MKVFLNNEENPIHDIAQLERDNNKKYLNGKFFYFICIKCNEVKEKRYYQYGHENTCICRECSYKDTISIKYNGKNPGALKMRESMLQKYGTTSTASFIDYSKVNYAARNEKSKKTLMEKYGVDNASKVESVKLKIKETNLKKYGTEVASKSEIVKDKERQTIKDRYGDNLPGAMASHKKFLEQRKIETEKLELSWLDEESFHGKYENGPIYYTFKCNKCGTIFKDDFHSGLPICKQCNPSWSNVSHAEKEIVSYIRSIYKGTIIENDRVQLDGKELDIFLPEINFALEYNGTYWHGYRKDSTLSIGQFKKKIEEKKLLCNKKGIRLVTIDEADYTANPEVFKRFIYDCIMPRKRIFARKCEIKEIDTKTAKEFMEYYHVNGYRGGYIKYGLYDKDEGLVCVAIFGHHPKYENECIRLCYKTGISIIGGWEKIQKHFGKKFLHYVNLKYFNGVNKTGCGYRFYLHKKLISRNQLQGKTLSKYIDNIDPNLSDFQNCLMNNGIAVFDLGNDIRIYN